jgi:hypothetical protein
MKREKRSVGRRTFLAGLLTGGGVAAGVGAASGKAAATKVETRQTTVSEPVPVLYHRTEETERYYRTLYR